MEERAVINAPYHARCKTVLSQAQLSTVRDGSTGRLRWRKYQGRDASWWWECALRVRRISSTAGALMRLGAIISWLPKKSVMSGTPTLTGGKKIASLMDIF